MRVATGAAVNIANGSGDLATEQGSAQGATAEPGRSKRARRIAGPCIVTLKK
jgi:hypothetical protein